MRLHMTEGGRGGGQSTAGASRRPYFGRRIKELRESYVTRIEAAGQMTSLLVRAPSTQAMVRCLRGHNVSISAAAYNEIEQGF